MEKLIENRVTDEDVKKEILSLIKDDISEDLEYICTSTDMMERLIKGLIRVSRVGTNELDLKTVDMDNLISGIIDTLKYRTQDVEAEIVFDRLPDCTGDKDQITQVFTNLIDNALKYLDPNQKGAIRLTVETKEDRHIYCVEDNGIGINEAYHDKIFEIYHRLDPKSSAKGEGLGLTIVQRIVDRHNGDIWLESEPGKGSKFYISLPIGG
jgi:light-regulated signal transduction histidine kinase (bacteriophytochrome)